MIRTTSRMFLFAFALLACAFLIAACGEDDSSKKDSKSDSSMTEDTTATTDTETTTTEESTSGGGSVEAGSTLMASVGPGFEITLKDADGNDVTEVPAGKYTIEVDDQSDIHNFHLEGPGVDEQTEVSETGKKTWNVEFSAGDYTFQCDPHPDSMNGAFKVA